MRYTFWAAIGLAALLPLGNARAAQKLVNLDVQNHGTPDANAEDLGLDPTFIPGENPWLGIPPDGVPDLLDFDGTDPVNLRDDQWNYLNLLDLTPDGGGLQDTPTPLNDIVGAPTGIGFQFTSPLANLVGGVRSDGSFGAEADDVARDEIHNANPDIIGGTGLSIDWKLTGLDTSGETTYDVYVIATNIWSGGWRETLVTDANGQGLKQQIGSDDFPSLYLGGPLIGLDMDGNYKHFTDWEDLVPDANGEISGIVRDYNDAGGEAYFSGLQIVVNSPDADADFDTDGDVDGADFLAWQRGFPGTYDATDLTAWQSAYGDGGGALSAVPEPATWMLATLAGLAMASRRRKV